MFGLPAGAGAIFKYGGLKVNQLTPEIICEITGALGFPLDPGSEKIDEITKLLKDNNVDALADIATNSGLQERLIALVKPPEPEGPVEILRFCSHCGKPNLIVLE